MKSLCTVNRNIMKTTNVFLFCSAIMTVDADQACSIFGPQMWLLNHRKVDAYIEMCAKERFFYFFFSVDRCLHASK